MWYLRAYIHRKADCYFIYIYIIYIYVYFYYDIIISMINTYMF